MTTSPIHIREVSCRSIIAALDAASYLGIDTDALLARLDMDKSLVRNPRSWVSWELSRRFTEELRNAVGGEENLIAVGRLTIQRKTYGRTFDVMRLITSPKLMYIATVRWAGPGDFPHVRGTIETLTDGRLRLEVAISPEYVADPNFFLITQGVFEGLPMAIGLRPSLVTSEISGHRCVYWISPPPSQTLWHRLKLAWRCLLNSSAIVDEIGTVHDKALARFDELRESKRDFLRIIENMPDGVVIHRDGQILYANPAFLSLLECESPKEALGRKLQEFFPSADWPALRAAVLAGDPSTIREISLKRRSGRPLIAELTRRADISFDGAPAVVIIARDLTAKRSIEHALADHQKLVALGEVAAEMAHEIRNPLAVVRLAAEKLLQLLDTDGDLARMRKVSEGILSNTERIRKIMDRLSRFSRKTVYDPMASHSIQQIIQEALSLCSSRLQRDGVMISVSDLQAAPNVSCRPSELCQVLVNLIQNACDAIQELDERWINLEVDHQQAVVHMSVTDSGSGIPLDTRERIFDPFFTTKPLGKGTGLGLSISKRIIEQHKGDLRIDSSSPNTRFIIQLPTITNQ